MRLLPRLDSLFTRLLLAQLGLVAVLAVVIAALFYVERNVTIALLYAERWAPQLASAAGLTPTPASPGEVLRRDAPPASARRLWAHTPRFAALREALAARGVAVGDIALGLDAPEPVVWLQVTAPGRPAVWLGVAGQMVIPERSRRVLLALGLSGLLLVGVSWVFTRRLTRPLERLRLRMVSHAPGSPPVGPGAAPIAAASPEIVAIDTAWSDLLARLAQHERERALLLAGVSHDLRSPLGRIRMAAELLPDNADVAARKATLVRNVGEMDRLIESFLDHVRSGELAFDETVDLAAAARAVVAGFDRPDHELSVSAPDSLAWPRANRLLVERLLGNLVDNALKHGRVPVRLSLGGTPAKAWIEVEDAGEGMPPAERGRLQEAFTRGDHSRTTPGTGLGLAIVRQIVARLGGELAFKRGPGWHRVRVRLGPR